MEFFKKETRYLFMARRKLWYAVSALMILVSVGSLAFRGLNLAVDFTGGVAIEAAFPAAPDLDAIRSGLNTAGFADNQVQSFGTSRDVLIRLPPAEGRTGAEIRAAVVRVLTGIDPKAEVRRLEFVGPQVGAELRESAIWAFAFTMLLIFIYVMLRFHTWRLSVGAIIAALHDPLLVVGFFSLTWIPFDLAVVAAILAVIGYSLNDTVVVFDRIRERFHVNRRSPAAQVLDEAINQTLSRTLMTSVTVLIVVVTLYVLGGPALQGFSAAIIVGVLVGTYSSIYIASSVALDLRLEAEHIYPTQKRTAEDRLP
jgi:preprotein translocase subunit SecF